VTQERPAHTLLVDEARSRRDLSERHRRLLQQLFGRVDTHHLDGFPLVLVVTLLKRRETLRVMRTNWVPGLVAGVVSLIAIWMVMWALALAPMAYVSALRETSTMFAVIIGVVFLKEQPICAGSPRCFARRQAP
jgi:hypothetical protein